MSSLKLFWLFFLANFDVSLSQTFSLSPPPGAYFQLKNAQSGRCMIDRNNADGVIRDVGHTNSCCRTCDDQLYRLIAHPTDNEYFKIQNVETGEIIISNSDGRFRTYPNTGPSYDDQYWKFVNDNSPFSIFDLRFRLKNKQSNRVIVSNSDGRFRDYPDLGNNADKYWEYILEDYEVIDMSFDLDNGFVFVNPPETAEDQECDNTHGAQSILIKTFSYTVTVTETSTFSKTHGIDVSLSTTFSTGIPFLAEGEISAGLTQSNSWGFGTQDTETKTYTETGTFQCAPGERIRLLCIFDTANVDVTYIMTLRTFRTNLIFNSFGTWTGLQSRQSKCTLFDILSADRFPVIDEWDMVLV